MTTSQRPPDREHVTDPVRSELSTTVAAADLGAGSPRSGRVVLGGDELVYATADESLRIEFADICDVALDYIPSGLEGTFSSTVGVSYRRDDRTRVSVIECSGHQQRAFANELLEAVLRGIDVFVTHPTRIDGRTTDNPPQNARLGIKDGELLVVADRTRLFRVVLANLSAVERGRQAVPDGMNEALLLRYSRDDTELLTKLSTGDARLFTLLDRRVRHGFRRIKQTVRQLSLTADEEDVLAALFLKPSTRDIESVVEKRPSKLDDILSGLELNNLVVRTDSGPALTELGRSTIKAVINRAEGARFAVFQSS